MFFFIELTFAIVEGGEFLIGVLAVDNYDIDLVSV
jgi:hypothetical protein